jgi:hypothetical protein
LGGAGESVREADIVKASRTVEAEINFIQLIGDSQRHNKSAIVIKHSLFTLTLFPLTHLIP